MEEKSESDTLRLTRYTHRMNAQTTDAPTETRIESLRERESQGKPLTAEERTELDAYYERIETQEALYLTPATERLRAERLQIEESLRRLEAIKSQKQEAVQRLESLIREIESLTTEEQRILTAARA